MHKSLVLVSFLVASALAGELFAHVVEPLPQHILEQNTATGEYGYSYSGGPSAKTEFRALDGTTTGAYSYIDAHGIIQTVNYIADDFGFRAAGTNIPSEGHALPLDAPEVAAAKAAHLAEHARAALGHQQRRKRGILVNPVALLPVSSSSQSRVQVHRSAHLVAHHQPVAIAPAPAIFLRKKRSLAAAAYVAPLYTSAIEHHLPLSSSRQDRFQIHKGAKIIQEYHEPIYAAAPIVEARAPLALAAPVAPAIEHHLPLSSSRQDRFQIHKDAKIIQEYYQPIYAAAPIVEARAPLALAAPVAPAIEHLPLSSSRQDRFQIHKDAKLIQEYHQPIYATAPIAPAYLPAFPSPAKEYLPTLPSIAKEYLPAPSSPAKEYLPASPSPAKEYLPTAPAAAPAAEAVVSEEPVAVESA